MSLKIKITTIITVWILILFFFDAGVTVLSKLDTGFYRISLVPRMLLELFLIIFMIKYSREKIILRSIKVIGLLVGVFILGSCGYLFLGNEINVAENIIAFNKYILFFMLYPVMRFLYDNKHLSRVRLFRIYEFIIYVNTIAVIAGFVFKIDLFLSYSGFPRFGYKGFIYAINEASAFSIIALLYSIYKYHIERKYFLLILVFISNILLGTKVAYFGTFMALFGYNLFVRKSKIKTLVYAFLASIGLGIIYTLTQLNNSSMFEYYVYKYNEVGLINMLFSGRNQYLTFNFIPLVSSWSPINWLFGGSNVMTNNIEMDFFDLFLLMGIVGTIVYLLNYALFIIDKKNLSFSLLILIVYLFCAATGGHFLYSAINTAYLSILLLKIKTKREFYVQK